MTARPAVFLDRDGVLIADMDLLVRDDEMRVLPGVPEGLRALADAGLALVVVSNQTVIARGMATTKDVVAMNTRVADEIHTRGGPRLAHFYFCPHHPRATLDEYRITCACRKPRPGLLLQAARELDLDVTCSFMVGDRVSDLAAGRAAGCRTILVESGAHLKPPIITDVPMDDVRAEHVCPGLREAAAWILAAG